MVFWSFSMSGRFPEVVAGQDSIRNEKKVCSAPYMDGNIDLWASQEYSDLVQVAENRDAW